MSPTIEDIKNIITIISSCVSTAGIVIGGIFAWWRWGREAPTVRRGELIHEVVHSLVSNSQRLVHVTFNMKNTGTATLRPTEAYTTIFQVLPLAGEFAAKLLEGTAPLDVTKTMFEWPTLGRRDYPVVEEQLRIDSGESEKYDADFIIPASVSAVFVYSMACLDPQDSDLGWDVTTFHQFAAIQ
jgi:hypothetical protein